MLTISQTATKTYHYHHPTLFYCWQLSNSSKSKTFFNRRKELKRHVKGPVVVRQLLRSGSQVVGAICKTPVETTVTSAEQLVRQGFYGVRKQ